MVRVDGVEVRWCDEMLEGSLLFPAFISSRSVSAGFHVGVILMGTPARLAFLGVEAAARVTKGLRRLTTPPRANDSLTCTPTSSSQKNLLLPSRK